MLLLLLLISLCPSRRRCLRMPNVPGPLMMVLANASVGKLTDRLPRVAPQELYLRSNCCEGGTGRATAQCLKARPRLRFTTSPALSTK